MIERVELNYDKFILLRRILAVAAFALTCLCLLLMFLGFVPLFGKNMNLIAAVTGVFEFIHLGKGAFWNRVASITFSVVYIVIAVKMIIYIISALKNIKIWFFNASDNEATRMKAMIVRYYARKSVQMLFLLYVLSYVFSEFTVGVLSAIMLAALILLEFGINAAYQLVFSAEVKTGIINAANSAILWIALLLFTFFCTDVQVIDMIKSIAGILNALNIDGIGGEMLLQMLLSQIMIPVFNILMIVSLVRINMDKLDGYFDEQERAKKLLIRNIVFVCIIFVGIGYINQYSSVPDYLGLLYRNSIFIITSAVVYISLMNKTVNLEEIPYYKPSEEESDPVQEETTQPNETEVEMPPRS